MDTELIGIAAGIGTAFSWSISSMIHARASSLMGVQQFMMLRQPFAALVLALICLLLGEMPEFQMHALFMAVLSGITGIVISDWCAYAAILKIGIRATLVCLSLNACCTAILGVFFLDEYLNMQGLAGIAICTAGVIMVVVAEKHDVHNSISSRTRNRGLVLALCAALTLAIGMLASKESLRCGMSPLSLAFLRNIAASVLLWMCGLALHRIKEALKALAKPEIIQCMLFGCFFGPAGGIWISCIALQYAPAGVAATLIGLEPVAVMIVSGIYERRCPPAASIIGACIACSGAALLLLR